MTTSIFSWVLLTLAIVEVLVGLAELYILNQIQQVVHEMTRPQAWGFMVGLPFVTVALAIWSILIPGETHPNGWLLEACFGIVSFFVITALLFGAAKPIVDVFRGWDSDNDRRDLIIWQKRFTHSDK